MIQLHSPSTPLSCGSDEPYARSGIPSSWPHAARSAVSSAGLAGVWLGSASSSSQVEGSPRAPREALEEQRLLVVTIDHQYLALLSRLLIRLVDEASTGLLAFWSTRLFTTLVGTWSGLAFPLSQIEGLSRTSRMMPDRGLPWVDENFARVCASSLSCQRM
jgi:hypothetical protein